MSAIIYKDPIRAKKAHRRENVVTVGRPSQRQQKPIDLKEAAI